jgi:hypothetical protein
MSMIKRLIIYSLFIFINAGFSWGTTVTATIVSPDGYPYASGTVIATLTPITGTIACNQYKVNGVSMGGSTTPCIVQGTMNSSGAFTITLTDDHTIFPTGSLWSITVCAQANNSCSSSLQDVFGTSINLSTAINNTLPTIAASAFQYPRMFANPEAAVSGLGSAYYNLIDNSIHLCIANPCSTNGNWISIGGSGGAVVGMAQGQPAGGGLTATSLDALNYSVAVSSWCGAISTCPLYTDESYAIHAIVQAFGAGGISLHIIDDMIGSQTWSRQPLTGMSGIFEDSHLGQHIINLDGMSSFEIPSTVHVIGMGSNANAQVPSNSWIQPCNPAIQNCNNGGFQGQSSSITSFVVSGDVATLTVPGTPFDTTTSDVNAVQTYRLIHIYGLNASGANNAWVVKAVTQTTAPQIITLWVVSGVTGSCNSGCTGTANLETPIVVNSTGGGGSTGQYHSGIDGFTINANYFPATGCYVQGEGEEAVGTGMMGIQCFNANDYYFRFDQSPAYGGSAGGDTNSMGSGPLEGNINPVFCTKTGGCSCNIGSAGCTTGTVPVNTLMSCGAGGVTATINPDPCANGNFVGMLNTGAVGPQGPGRFKGHLTMSIADKSNGGGSGIPQMVGSGATQASAFGNYGSTGVYDPIHGEYFNLGVAACGDVATQATWEEAYGSIPTTGVLFHGSSAFAFNSGGIGIDIGSAGNWANCTNIRFDGFNIGNGGSQIALQDNLTGVKCSDGTITYEHGNQTNPVLENSCVNTHSTNMSGPVLSMATAALYNDTGTTFTSNAGCTETGLTGGATHGSFTIGTSSACTTILTFGGVTFPPNNGYTCWAFDMTNAPSVPIRQSGALSTAHVTFKMTATSGDLIVFGCNGF